MIFMDMTFSEYICDVRTKCKKIWNKTSSDDSLRNFKSFVPERVLYSKINKKKIYPELGYFANELDCVCRENKPNNISGNKPKRFSHICYLMKNGFPRYIYTNEDGKDLLGGLICVLNKHLYFGFDVDSGNIFNIVFYEESDDTLTRFSISNYGEIVEAIIYSKNKNKFYYLLCTPFADSLEEVLIDSKRKMASVKIIAKQLRDNNTVCRIA